MPPQAGWGDIILKNRQKVPHFLLSNNNTLILSGCELDLKGKAQYAMNYSGRVLAQQFSGDFLKKALRHASPDMPYRGPEYYSIHNGNGRLWRFLFPHDAMPERSWKTPIMHIQEQSLKSRDCSWMNFFTSAPSSAVPGAHPFSL